MQSLQLLNESACVCLGNRNFLTGECS